MAGSAQNPAGISDLQASSQRSRRSSLQGSPEPIAALNKISHPGVLHPVSPPGTSGGCENALSTR